MFSYYFNNYTSSEICIAQCIKHWSCEPGLVCSLSQDTFFFFPNGEPASRPDNAPTSHTYVPGNGSHKYRRIFRGQEKRKKKRTTTNNSCTTQSKWVIAKQGAPLVEEIRGPCWRQWKMIQSLVESNAKLIGHLTRTLPRGRWIWSTHDIGLAPAGRLESVRR